MVGVENYLELSICKWNLCTEQVINGLDQAVKNMKKGEVAVVTIHPEYAFGSTDSQEDLAIVPANSTVYYEVELLSFVKVSLICSLVFVIFMCLQLVWEDMVLKLVIFI